MSTFLYRRPVELSLPSVASPTNRKNGVGALIRKAKDPILSHAEFSATYKRARYLS